MGVSSSREGRVYHETQSIVTRVHQKYNTESNGRNVADRLHVYRETRIVEDQGKKEIFHKESVKRVVDPQKGGKDETLARKTVKISFNRKDLSAPLAVTLESITRQDNWPPLPSGFPIGPCFYQDINVDIPLEFQKIVRMLYYLWMFHALMLLLNILGGLGLFIAFKSGVTFGLAILYFLIFTPFSYICWFRPIYKAFRSDSSFNFMVFFFVFFFQLIVSIVNAIGIPSMGTCGIVLGLSYLGSSGWSYKVAGVFILVLAAGFVMVALADLAALTQVHRIYRSTGASFAKAQVEFSQGVMRNEHVQSFTANAASAAVRNQFSGATTPGGTAASPRF
ncbi:secretory carrier-associated membrane protein 5 isoform X5 [Macrobrachium rosenbergii]|uniref:secretory carrier-associated membrane protein 5 isoform X5 n=1 Tax=Macrobrachium rosenbergii TaxID=79674 RepID=UPI0034D69262